MVKDYFKNVERAVKSIRKKVKAFPQTGIILGSGWGDFTAKIKGCIIPYADIHGIPHSCIKGQEGILKIGNDCAIFAGRFHYYQGYTLAEVVLPVFILKELGIKQLIITNAAGGIHPSFNVGDLVLINDHINLMGNNPLRGPYEEHQGVRFPDMTDAYSKRLIKLAKKSESSLKEGVYAALSGPNYETPAEIRMLAILGADMVGMSTVPEVIAASFLSLEVLGISCITNMAAGISNRKLNHDDVIATGKKAGHMLSSFLLSFLKATGSAL
ncbi:MAG: purine-nucleoside phosphorylase [Spirochaetales bacterium]|nr:purine-nucleoside phosphorylase [Spirochaetales bacterium]